MKQKTIDERILRWLLRNGAVFKYFGHKIRIIFRYFVHKLQPWSKLQNFEQKNISIAKSIDAFHDLTKILWKHRTLAENNKTA